MPIDKLTFRSSAKSMIIAQSGIPASRKSLLSTLGFYEIKDEVGVVKFVDRVQAGDIIVTPAYVYSYTGHRLIPVCPRGLAIEGLGKGDPETRDARSFVTPPTDAAIRSAARLVTSDDYLLGHFLFGGSGYVSGSYWCIDLGTSQVLIGNAVTHPTITSAPYNLVQAPVSPLSRENWLPYNRASVSLTDPTLMVTGALNSLINAIQATILVDDIINEATMDGFIEHVDRGPWLPVKVTAVEGNYRLDTVVDQTIAVRPVSGSLLSLSANRVWLRPDAVDTGRDYRFEVPCYVDGVQDVKQLNASAAAGLEQQYVFDGQVFDIPPGGSVDSRFQYDVLCETGQYCIPLDAVTALPLELTERTTPYFRKKVRSGGAYLMANFLAHAGIQ